MTDKSDKYSDYLWDGTGPIDPEVAEIEEALRPLRFEREMPEELLVAEKKTIRVEVGEELVQHRARLRTRRVAVMWLMMAACFALIYWAFETQQFSPRADIEHVAPRPGPIGPPTSSPPAAGPGWTVRTVAGLPTCDGAPIQDGSKLGEGQWLRTDERSSAQLEVADIGKLDVAPGSTLRLVETHEKSHRLELTGGSIHAKVDAPPRLFLVDTPNARAVDLGCEYTLDVEPDGSSVLEVDTGWVALESDDAIAVVAKGSRCKTYASGAIGIPVRVKAPAAFAETIGSIERGGTLQEIGPAVIADALESAGPEDLSTLWHLMTRFESTYLHGVVLARMIDLGATEPRRDASALVGDRDAMLAWGAVIGVVPASMAPDAPPVWDPSNRKPSEAPPVWGPGDGAVPDGATGSKRQPTKGGATGAASAEPGSTKRDPAEHEPSHRQNP